MVEINLGEYTVIMDLEADVIGRSVEQFKTVATGYGFVLGNIKKKEQTPRKFNIFEYSLDIEGENIFPNASLLVSKIYETEDTLKVNFKFDPVTKPKVDPTLPW